MIETVSFSRSPEQYIEYANRSISRKIAEGIMTEADANLIREFVSTMRVQNNIGDARTYKLTNALSNICRFIKTPLMDNTIADINTGVMAIKNGQRIAGKNHKNIGPLSQDTKRDYVVFLKRLYLYAIEEGYCSISAEKIQKIKAPPKNKATKTAEQMLTKAEVVQMIHACKGITGIRDRAMLSVLYEGGLRINELAGLKWSDLKFEGPFVKLNVSSKTGIPRYIPLTMSKEYISSWRNEYPDGIPDGDKTVFLTTIRTYKETADGNTELVTIHRNLTYNYLRKHIREIGKRAGITKNITCHLFRHSRVTALLQDGFQESTIKLMLWGSLTSNMLANYGHLCNNDIDKAIAKAEGLELEGEETENPLSNKICPRCHTINTPTSGYCHVCGLPLTKDAAMELEEAKAEIHADERYKTVIENMQKQIDALTAFCGKE